MASISFDPTSLNEKYTLLCSEKCKLLNSIESVNRESKLIKNEICEIIDLISESKSNEELENIESESDSERTMDPFYERFLNLEFGKRNLEKIKSIQFRMNGKFSNAEKKTKRKSVKKIKLEGEQQGSVKAKPDSKSKDEESIITAYEA